MRGALRPEPLVAVVTPVHDGAVHLRRCMESVLRQEYENWIHLVVDNASRDRTRAIAEEIAARDDRIVVLHHPRFVPMLENFNRGLEAVPDEAIYVKQLHADDALFPECLRVMVDAAERHPQAGIVSGRRYAGGVLRPDRGPDRTTLVHGDEVVRAMLLGGINYLGTPSLPLLRRDRIAGWPRIFGTSAFPPRGDASLPFPHADKEAFLATLEKTHLVFVPRALIDQRRDTASATGRAQRVGAWHPSRIELILRHGTRLLDPSEVRRGVRLAVLRYVRSLAWRTSRCGALRDGEFVGYQALAIEHVIGRLREREHSPEALLLAPFAALLRRAGGRAGA